VRGLVGWSMVGWEKGERQVQKCKGTNRPAAGAKDGKVGEEGWVEYGVLSTDYRFERPRVRHELKGGPGRMRGMHKRPKAAALPYTRNPQPDTHGYLKAEPFSIRQPLTAISFIGWSRGVQCHSLPHISPLALSWACGLSLSPNITPCERTPL